MQISNPEAGVPIPSRYITSPLRKAIVQLKPGQSLTVTKAAQSNDTIQRSVAHWAKQDGIRVATRQIPGGIRVWRLMQKNEQEP